MAPSVRAAIIRDLLEAVAHQAPTVHDDARAALPSLDAPWIPIAECVAFYDLLQARVGRDQVMALYREALVSSQDGALLGSLWNAAALLLGKRPERYLSWFPKIYAILMRDLGTASFESRGDASCLRVHGVPALARHSVGWRESLRCPGTAIGEWLGFEVTSETTVADDAVSVVFRWQGTRPAERS